jgi:hypothetical protein
LAAGASQEHSRGSKSKYSAHGLASKCNHEARSSSIKNPHVAVDCKTSKTNPFFPSFCSTLQQTDRIFDGMSAAAAAAKAEAEEAQCSVSLAQHNSTQQTSTWHSLATANHPSHVDEVGHPTEGKGALGVPALQNARELASPAFMSPSPPSPTCRSSTQAFLRRAKPGTDTVTAALHDDTPPSPPAWLLDEGREALPDSDGGVGRRGRMKGVAPPPPTPFSKQFIRREAQENKLRHGAASRPSAPRRISYDSPVMTPMNQTASPGSTPKVNSAELARRIARI